MKPTDLALRLRGFSFGEYLLTQRQLSANTIRGYRDAFVLLLRYCREVRMLRVERLELDQVGTALEVDFLEHERQCSPATRNHRLTVIHSFFRYVQAEEPERLVQCQRIPVIPLRRINHADPTYLSDKDLAVLLRQPDRTTVAARPRWFFSPGGRPHPNRTGPCRLAVLLGHPHVEEVGLALNQIGCLMGHVHIHITGNSIFCDVDEIDNSGIT